MYRVDQVIEMAGRNRLALCGAAAAYVERQLDCGRSAAVGGSITCCSLWGKVRLCIEQVVSVARSGLEVQFSSAAEIRMRNSRQQFEQRLAGGQRIYGVNTGVGRNVNIALDAQRACNVCSTTS